MVRSDKYWDGFLVSSICKAIVSDELWLKYQNAFILVNIHIHPLQLTTLPALGPAPPHESAEKWDCQVHQGPQDLS